MQIYTVGIFKYKENIRRKLKQFVCKVFYGVVCIGQVKSGQAWEHAPSLRPLSAGTPGDSIWPSPRQMPDPSPSPWSADQPAATWGTWSAHWPPTLTRLPRWENLVSRISVRKMGHLSIQLQLMLTDYTGYKSHLSLSQQPLVGHKIWPVIVKDSPKRPGTERLESPSQIPGQSPSLTSVLQDRKHQGPEDSDFHPLHRYWQHHTPWSSELMTPQAWPRHLLTCSSQHADCRVMNATAKVSESKEST